MNIYSTLTLHEASVPSCGNLPLPCVCSCKMHPYLNFTTLQAFADQYRLMKIIGNPVAAPLLPPSLCFELSSTAGWKPLGCLTKVPHGMSSVG